MKKENCLRVGYFCLWDLTVSTCFTKFWVWILVFSAAEHREVSFQDDHRDNPSEG